ncbi:hypothetical protein PPROV_000234900 [Pycnococcus provasolii]|uniref:Transmembrane protein n=1 Tax=Pycnococcus provasolii TaxID=41880 RepID=A0A830H978_9CHLO|nr:hypothetical protein PPROV_000234900 [Pycnococcus provasolii]
MSRTTATTLTLTSSPAYEGDYAYPPATSAAAAAASLQSSMDPESAAKTHTFKIYRWRYLDVARVSDGYARLRLYFGIILALIITGGLSLFYETTLLRPWDRDARDMLFDKRTMGPLAQPLHDKLFVVASNPYWSEGGNAAQTSLAIPAIRLYTATEDACKGAYPVPCLADSTAVSMDKSAVNGALVDGTNDAFDTCDELRTAILNKNNSKDQTLWKNMAMRGLSVLAGSDLFEKRQIMSLSNLELANEACTKFDELKVTSCPRLLETCSQMDTLLRKAVGLYPYDEKIAGRVSVLTRTQTTRSRAALPKPSRPVLLLYSGGQEVTRLNLNVSRAFISSADVEAFVSEALKRSPASYIPPLSILGNVSLTDSVFVDGVQVPMSNRQESRGNLKPSKWGWENDLYPGTYPCSDTSYARAWLYGSINVKGASSSVGGPKPRFVTVAFGTAADDPLARRRTLPRHRLVQATAMDDVVSVARLRRIVITVTATNVDPSQWSFVDVQGYYETNGRKVSRNALQAELDANFVVSVEMRDAGEPPTNDTPAGHLGWEYLLGGIVIGGLGFMTSWNSPYLAYIALRNARENQNLPPPFYRSTLAYRGW